MGVCVRVCVCGGGRGGRGGGGQSVVVLVIVGPLDFYSMPFMTCDT
jgi:hypothetical protein